MVKMPAHQLAFVRPSFLLNRVVKISTPSSLCTDLTVRLTCCHKSLDVYSCADKNRVIWSWLTSPSTIADKPVAVAAPKSAQQIVRVQIKVSFFHPSSLSGRAA